MEVEHVFFYLYIFQHQRYESLSALLKRLASYPMFVSIVLKWAFLKRSYEKKKKEKFPVVG